MWLHIPSTVLASVQASEDLNSESALLSLDSGLYVTLSGKQVLRPFSWRGWKTRTWMMLLSGTTSRPLTAQRGAEQWILSLRASRASPGQSQGDAKESKMNAGYGATSSESYARYDLDSCSWKTFQASLFTLDLAPFSETWPKLGSMRNGVVSRRQKSGRVIGGSGFSFWRTPAQSDPDGGIFDTGLAQRMGYSPKLKLRDQVANLWASPGRAMSASDSKGVWNETHYIREDGSKVETVLTHQASQWPTPDATTATYSNGQRGMNLRELATTSHLLRTTSKDGHECSPKCRRLNPLFVEWLMGFRAEWTNYAPLATPLSLWKQRMRSQILWLG